MAPGTTQPSVCCCRRGVCLPLSVLLRLNTVSHVAQVKAGCEVLAAQARRSGRPVPKSLASPGEVATPDDHGAFFRGERQVPPQQGLGIFRLAWRRTACCSGRAVAMRTWLLLCCECQTCSLCGPARLAVSAASKRGLLSICFTLLQVFAGPSGVRVGSGNGASASGASRS
jgi:hypothetical protein